MAYDQCLWYDLGATYSFGRVGCGPMCPPTSAEQRRPTRGSAHTRGRSAGRRKSLRHTRTTSDG